MTLYINNSDVRKIWLSSQGLINPPTGPINILKIIKNLGFIQLDTIQNVSRAHHHILWSRNQNYREPMLDKLLKTNQHIFEHYTHDASVIPMDYYPMWTRQFKRKKEKLNKSKYYNAMSNEKERNLILDRIRQEGPLSTHAFDSQIMGQKKMWSRPPHKLALDYMWYCGELSTSHRENFKKFYDLTDRVVPESLRNETVSDEEQINWLCSEALSRLCFGTIKDIQNFWQATELTEVKTWTKKEGLKQIKWETFDGEWKSAFTHSNIEQRLQEISKPSTRIRIINPFDPLIRDRNRLKNFFGFNYKIEIFVPQHKRQWGYYVYPLLESDRFIGRIELKADRKANTLNILNFWPEPNVIWNKQRYKRLNAELTRLAQFVELKTINRLS